MKCFKSSKWDILRSLLSDNISTEEVMSAYDIFPHEVELHGSMAAFVYCSKAGNFHIFVNEALSPEAKREVLFHEIYHIVEDIPKLTYVLGMDMQYEKFEIWADKYGRKIAAAMP